MAAKPVKVAYVADTADLRSSLKKAEAAIEASGDTAKSAGKKIDTAFDSTAEHADTVASKGAQAAGALSGLGGLVGGKFGAAMTVGGVAMQGFADAGDLVNVVTESSAVLKAKDIAVIAAQTTATIAKTVADKAAAAASKAWAAAQWALNAAMEANPIGIVVAAIAALTAGVIIAYKKSDTFRSIVQGAFNGVKNAVTKMWDTAQGILNKLKAAFGAVGSAATGVWTSVKSAFDKIWDKISGLPGKVKGLGGDMLAAGTHMAQKLVDGISSIGGKAGDIAKSIVNKLIDFLNSALPHSLNTHIPGVGKVNLIPNIPHLAEGGVTTGPTLALIGDNPGGREAVVPLDKYDMGGGATADGLKAMARALEQQNKDQQARHKQMLTALRQAQRDAGAGAAGVLNKTARRARQHA